MKANFQWEMLLYRQAHFILSVKSEISESETHLLTKFAKIFFKGSLWAPNSGFWVKMM